MTATRGRGWRLWSCLMALLPLLAACYEVHPFFASSSRHSLPVHETASPFDRSEFVQYLDSAAVDDWEGIWLLLGREAYCYLAIERINDYVYETRYTHRIVLWFDINVADLYTYPSGMVMGYLEQDLTNQTRRITLYDVSFWNRWFYWQIPAVTATAHLSGDRTLIMLDDVPRRWKGDGRCGLKRIYPVRSYEETPYQVRYL